MAVTAVVSGNTIVINRDDINRELVYPISALHTELRKRGAYTDIGLFAGEKELVRVSNWPTEPGFGNSIFSLTDPEAISTEAEATLGIAGGGGGGGGSISQAQITAGMKAGLDTSDDIEAIRNAVAVNSYRVVTAHGTAPDNFTVNQRLKEYVSALGASIWRNDGSTTNLAVAPVKSNLENLSDTAINNAATSITANQLTIIDLLSNDIPGDPYGAIGTAGQALTVTIPAAPLGKRRILQALTCTYSGGTLPVNGLRVTVAYGQGGPVQSFTLTTDGPAPIDLGKNGTRGQVAVAASGDVVSPITITMLGSGTLVAEIMATAALGV